MFHSKYKADKVNITINEEIEGQRLSKISTIRFLTTDYHNYQNLLGSYNVSSI